MYKEANTECRQTVFMETIVNQLTLICRHIDFNSNVTYTSLYNEIVYHNVSGEAIDYFLDKFSVSIKRNMMEWGFSFLSDFNLKLIPIKNERSKII